MPSSSMPLRGLATLLVLSCLLGAGTAPGSAAPGQQSEKWYEQSRDGNKTGYRRVVWAPSTWEGRKTVHDTTTVVSQTQRDMAGLKDRFETTVVYDLERGLDGTLWWQRMRVEEAGRVRVVELRWTGKGYRHTDGIEGQDPQVVEIELDAPVMVDAEALLGQRAREGKLQADARYELRQLDFRARAARNEELVVIGREVVKDENDEEVACWKIMQRDPQSRHEALMWLDDDGFFVQVRDGAYLIRRTTRAKAEAMPARPAEFSITIPSVPRLERIFNADRVLVDVHVRGDAHRKLPEFPDSPWSRVLGVDGDDQQGWVVRAELRRHDVPEAKAEIPVSGARFERYLEATALMQVQHPLLKKTVRQVVGEEKDARKAASALARYVFARLEKQSPRVGQGDAVQILTECKGDCSEHALVFVALCRAAGIPARLCSGYVCIGSIWGAHSWAEIWTGTWIGADPTTGEVGSAARYLFFGYPDEPGSFPSVVSARAAGRLRIVTKRLEEGNAAFDLGEESGHRIYDREGRRYIHVLAGLEARGVPGEWTVDLSHDRLMRLSGDGFTVQIRASGDQGQGMDTLGRLFPGKDVTFAGVPGRMRRFGGTRVFLLFSRRRIVQVHVSGGDADQLEEIERVLAPTFAEPALAWDVPAPSPAPAGPDDD